MTPESIVPVILHVPGRNQQVVTDLYRACTSAFGVCYVHQDDAGKGAALSTVEAIRCVVCRHPDRYVLFLEDDVVMSPVAGLILRFFDYPESCGVVSLCDMREMPIKCQSGLYIRDARGVDRTGWWGNQAMLIHPETAAMLAFSNWFDPSISQLPAVQAHKALYGDAGLNCSDIRMSWLVHRNGGARNQYGVYVPSLFKHVGVRSECFPNRAPELGERETRNWIGDLPCDPNNRYPRDVRIVNREHPAGISLHGAVECDLSDQAHRILSGATLRPAKDVSGFSQ